VQQTVRRKFGEIVRRVRGKVEYASKGGRPFGRLKGEEDRPFLKTPITFGRRNAGDRGRE